MKLRISKQSLRFRLNPQDIEALQVQKSLGERLMITPQTEWSYALTLNSVHSPQVLSKNSHIEIQVPENDFIPWLQGKEIEWSFEQQNPELSISIEKDLKPNRR